VGIGVGDIEEERLVVETGEKIKCFLGIARSEEFAVGGFFEVLGVANEGKGFHVDAVGDSIVGVEAAFGGKILGGVSEVPLSDGFRGVSLMAEEVGEGGFLEREA
jgi:hypothetical protein